MKMRRAILIIPIFGCLYMAYRKLLFAVAKSSDFAFGELTFYIICFILLIIWYRKLPEEKETP